MFGPIFGFTSLFSTVRAPLPETRLAASRQRVRRLVTVPACLCTCFVQVGGMCVSPVVAVAGDVGSVAVCVAVLLLSLLPAHWAYTVHTSEDATPGVTQRPPKHGPAVVPAGLDVDDSAGSSDHEAHAGGATGAVHKRTTDSVGATAAPAAFGGVWASVSDAIGLSSLNAAPVLPWLFTCTVVMQVLATCVSLAFTNYLVVGYVAADTSCTWPCPPVGASVVTTLANNHQQLKLTTS